MRVIGVVGVVLVLVAVGMQPAAARAEGTAARATVSSALPPDPDELPVRVARPNALVGVLEAVTSDGEALRYPLGGVEYVHNFGSYLALDVSVRTVVAMTLAEFGGRVYLLSAAVSPFAALRFGVCNQHGDDDGPGGTLPYLTPGLGLEVTARGGFTASFEAHAWLNFRDVSSWGRAWLLSFALGYRF